MAAFFAGFPETVPVRTVNRQCSSGLQVVADVAVAITAGFYDIGIGAGVESMTSHSVPWDGTVNPKVESNQRTQDCLLPMGITPENVAERYGVGRKQQDSASVTSHQRAAAATAMGNSKKKLFLCTRSW
jgi:acetyl-CoA acyltransferase 1